MKWSTDFEEIVKYKSSRISKFEFDKPTTDFLVLYGLPRDAAPFLSFAGDSDERYGGIAKLTERYDFLEQEFERYIAIGSNGNGDEIVIDTKDS